MVVGGFVFILTSYPDVAPAPQIDVARTPAQIERGQYLAEQVTVCQTCHTPRDYSMFAGPIKQDRLGAGGERWDQSMGLPGVLYADNITPAALGEWTDGEILRAFTSGVSRDGTALFPLMPYHAYGRMDVADAEAIVAYLRQIPAIEHDVPDRSLDPPLNLVVRLMPQQADPQPVPSTSDELTYGEYVTTIAACSACHTPLTTDGQPVVEMGYAGGHEYPLPTGGIVRAANITPHEASGIGSWSREQFIARFRAMNGARESVAPGAFNTVMPWTDYGKMTEQDLGAIYTYLMSLPAIDHFVVRFTPGI
ncbi:MAG: cytochrome C [Gemmatimonadetes bacterium]|jgi:mono/diheme cytochrome c family protein|nr:cytochrome C [Gemmatimonadota bacterium]MBT5054929.1 cytochrome C [Gemmatimonadota bacterium]MBT5145850.1 cytochrome C [Gemmatimonadota bacterium]MBT5587831.1 cytochrome C [Gemmatimonadota bacterium]MBT5962995.1 cytochrome C [Gemmatimonadota bacterium]